jgi:hypothetical protein
VRLKRSSWHCFDLTCECFFGEHKQAPEIPQLCRHALVICPDASQWEIVVFTVLTGCFCKLSSMLGLGRVTGSGRRQTHRRQRLKAPRPGTQKVPVAESSSTCTKYFVPSLFESSRSQTRADAGLKWTSLGDGQM